MDRETRIGFVGAGRVGTALAVALHAAGYTVVAAASRPSAEGSAERLAARVPGCRALPDAQAVAEAADLVFITPPDDVIASVARSVRWRPGQAAVHCGGALGVEALAAAKAQGAQVGAFHPLQAFAGGKAAPDVLYGITFALEGEPPLRDGLADMARALGGRSVVLQPGDRALYHAAAAFASNYAVTLASLAARLWERCRIPQDEALRALLPLLRGTISNLETLGLPQALTGPIARGDVGTLRKHIAALESRAPEVVAAYRTLALNTFPIALAKGTLSLARAREMRALLGPTTGTETTESGVAAFDGGKKAMRTVLKSKIHRATVTEANIAYEGSLTLDPDLMDAADILPYEKVWVLDVDNGARLTTYVIEGERGSGTVCINGAAARLVHKGDTAILLTYATVEEEKARQGRPRLVYVDRMNRITHTKNVDDR